MNIRNRRQFRQYWEEIAPGISEPGGVLWAQEKYRNKKCRWFVCIRPIRPVVEKQEYRLWCNQHCAGQVLCYSSSDTEEWWGFSHHADIVLWLLRWS